LADGSTMLNDVWKSPNGINWTEMTSSAQWDERYIHSSVVHNNTMWVLGGWSGNTIRWNDAWSSVLVPTRPPTNAPTFISTTTESSTASPSQMDGPASSSSSSSTPRQRNLSLLVGCICGVFVGMLFLIVIVCYTKGKKKTNRKINIYGVKEKDDNNSDGSFSNASGNPSPSVPIPTPTRRAHSLTTIRSSFTVAPESPNIELIDNNAFIRNRYLINRDDLEIDMNCVLGSGAFGVVYAGVWMEGRRKYEVAVKAVSLKQRLVRPTGEDCGDEGQAGSVQSNCPQGYALVASDNSDVLIEAEIMATLRSPFIVQMHGICIEPDTSYLVLEKMTNASLFKYIAALDVEAENRKSIEERTVFLDIRVQFLKDIIRGLDYLHEKNVIHCDLKSPNILLTTEGGDIKAKISDFGLARIVSSDDAILTTNPAMSLFWAAPEMLRQKKVVTKCVDIYAFGVIMWEVMAMRSPYAHSTCIDVINFVTSGQREAIPSHCPGIIRDLIGRCWSQDPADRMKASEVSEELMCVTVVEPCKKPTALAATPSYTDADISATAPSGAVVDNDGIQAFGDYEAMKSPSPAVSEGDCAAGAVDGADGADEQAPSPNWSGHSLNEEDSMC
jgi:serine/threonine protein kinase